MHITLQEALSIYPMSKAKLVAGFEGSNRIIKSINVLDNPDQASNIKHGELLFATAYMLKDAQEDATSLIRKLNERGASGLGIKLGLFWSDIPISMIECANSLQFPLIELPFQHDISDQIQAFYHAEYERNSKVLHSILEKQKLLMQYALKRDEINNTIRSVGNILGHPIAVIGSRGHVFHNATKWDSIDLLNDWPWSPSKQWVNHLLGRYLRYPLMQNEENLGFLLIMPEEWSLVRAEERLYQQAAEILSFHMGINYISYIETTLQDDVGSKISRYLRGKTKIEDVIESAHRMEIDLFKGKYLCVLSTIRNSDGNLHDNERLRELRQELIFDPRFQQLNGQHFYVQEGVLSIFSFGEDLQPTASSLIKTLRIQFDTFSAKKDDHQVFHMIFSNMKEEPQQLAEAFKEIKHTLNLAERFQMRQLIIQYETIEFDHLFQFVPKHVMEEYVEKTLQPLLTKNSDQANELLSTLITYLDHDGKLNETAKELYLHRNTVNYRLDKISELLHIDMKHMGDLLKIKLVLLFKDFLAR